MYIKKFIFLVFIFNFFYICSSDVLQNTIAQCKAEIIQLKSDIKKVNFVVLEIGENTQGLYLAIMKHNSQDIIKHEIQNIKAQYTEDVFLKAMLELSS